MGDRGVTSFRVVCPDGWSQGTETSLEAALDKAQADDAGHDAATCTEPHRVQVLEGEWKDVEP